MSLHRGHRRRCNIEKNQHGNRENELHLVGVLILFQKINMNCFGTSIEFCEPKMDASFGVLDDGCMLRFRERGLGVAIDPRDISIPRKSAGSG
jgi:hypothetical protein